MERERDKGDVDSIKGPGHDLSTKYVCGFHEEIQHKWKSTTLVPYASILLGLTLKMSPLQSLLPAGR